jgi:hypothetical protein
VSARIVSVGGPSPAAPATLGRYAQRIAVIRPLLTGERAEVWVFGDDGIAIVSVDKQRGRSAGGRVVFAGTGYRQGAAGGGDIGIAGDAFAFGSHWADEPTAEAEASGIVIDRAWWRSPLADSAEAAVLDAAERAGW